MKTPTQLFKLPLTVRYDETGGYDCMSSGYDIIDSRGKVILLVDVRDIEPDRVLCDYGESEKARAIAEWIVECANSEVAP